MQWRMLKTVSHWSCFLLVISSGCGVLFLSLHIRVSSIGSGGNKVHSRPFIWFDQQTLEVFLLELGLHQWAVNLRRESLSGMALPKFLSLFLSCLYVWSCRYSVNLPLPQPTPLWTLLHANVSHDHYDVNVWERGWVMKTEDQKTDYWTSLLTLW